MHVVMRSYSGQGGTDLLDLLEQREQEVRELISGVPGFIHYVAFRTDDGGCTVTVCEGKEGTDESSRRAADWVKENLSTSTGAPTISEGDAVLQF
jgi:hypothetical protein